MTRSSRHPREVRERAVALVLESQSDYGSQWEAIVSVAGKVGALAESRYAGGFVRPRSMRVGGRGRRLRMRRRFASCGGRIVSCGGRIRS